MFLSAWINHDVLSLIIVFHQRKLNTSSFRTFLGVVVVVVVMWCGCGFDCCFHYSVFKNAHGFRPLVGVVCLLGRRS